MGKVKLPPEYTGGDSHILNHVLPKPAPVELADGDAVDMYAEAYYMISRLIRN